LGTLLNKYPQFNGDFEGLMLEEASSWYNALQIRFQKRTTHHISFEGSYTISKETDDSSAGRNNWVGSLGAGIPQQLDRLNLEHSIGANDTPQRLAAAVSRGSADWAQAMDWRQYEPSGRRRCGRLVAGDDCSRSNRDSPWPSACPTPVWRMAPSARKLCAPN
jgi:hypothetical protein